MGYESDGVDYTFRSGLPYPTGEDGAPDELDILPAPVTLEEDHGHAGSLITIADGDLAFATEALYGEDTPRTATSAATGAPSSPTCAKATARSSAPAPPGARTCPGPHPDADHHAERAELVSRR